MTKKTKILASALCLAVMGASVGTFAGCAGGEGTGGEEGEITITGSTSVQPLMLKLAAAYEEKHEGIVINVGGGGSGTGVTNAMEGKNDFGMASRGAKEGEEGVVFKKIADDGIAIIVNRNCTVTNVTKAEVKALYEQGTAIQNALLAALSRSDGSGTRDAFDELIGIETLYSGGVGFEKIEQTTAVITNIKENNAGNTVGYISLGSLTSEVKALKFEGVEATTANVSNGSYALARPFNIVYKSESELTSIAKDFIDWIVSEEGQAIVTENGYIAL